MYIIHNTPAPDEPGYTLLGKPSHHHQHEAPSQPATTGAQSLSLKITTATLKLEDIPIPLSGRRDREGSMMGTASPESVLYILYICK